MVKNNELKYRKKILANFFDYASDGVIAVDPKTRGIIYVNQTACKIFGYTKKEFESLSVNDIHPKDMIKKVDGIFKQASSNKVSDHKSTVLNDIPCVNKLSKQFYCNASGTVINFSDQKVMVGFFRDKTEEIEFQEKSKNLEKRYLGLFNNMRSGVAVYEVRNEGEEIVFKDFNRAAEKIDGVKKEDILGKDVRKVFPGVVDFGLLEVFKKVYKTGRAKEHPIALYKDKRITSWRENYVYKLPTDEVVAVYNDVTDQKKIEVELNQLASVVKYSSELINISDLDGQMTFINEAGSKMLGIKPKDVDKYNILEVIPEEYMTLVKTELLPSLLRGEDWEGDLAYKNIRTGKITDVHAITFTVNSEETGKPLFFAYVSADITERKKVEKIKSDFISLASHQLRTPLAGTKWFIELLLSERQGKLNKKQKQMIRQVNQSNERLINLVYDLLDTTHLENGDKYEFKKKETDIVEIIDKLLQDKLLSVSKKRVLVKKLKNIPQSLLVKVDAEKIEQVFRNLISNAVKFSKKGGKVTIGCKTNKMGDKVFYVTDNGIGIPKAQHKRVFEKFFRADNTVGTQGTGLGLYLVKKIVEGHGGKIWFKSDLKRGTTMYFTLPK